MDANPVIFCRGELGWELGGREELRAESEELEAALLGRARWRGTELALIGVG